MDTKTRDFPDQEKQDHLEHQDGSAEDNDAQESRVNLERIPTYLQPSISVRQRLQHFTFAWYTLTMSTGGIALTLGNTPHRFRGLDVIGLIVYFFDIACFAVISSCLILRFLLYKDSFHRTFTRPKEALLVPTFFLSIATLLTNAAKYGSIFLSDKAFSGLAVFLRITFWMYLAATFLYSIFQYHILFTVKETRRLQSSTMTPGWILPIFPVMLAGTIAAADSTSQSPAQALAMITAGTAAQGLGFFFSIFFYAIYMNRLITHGLPSHRPAMFIAVGPPSFTCLALVAMASDVPRIFEAQVPVVEGMMSPELLGYSVKLGAIYCALFLWGLSFWFFASGVASNVLAMVSMINTPDRRFRLNWWSFVFPNVGFAISTIRIGTVMGNEGMLWFGSALTIILVIVWLFVLFRCVYGVMKREIVWPGHDEDSD
ncbi:Malic acid transport protein [Cytospora mali]|uniref:Malic acid transport protein n=1 Tax=Cytospora mali TaxID=578113 RepID=A0A194VAV1_CYTMA|nr:Malic acid transport protein [Valsa mali var. pyri (nom. inval.)]